MDCYATERHVGWNVQDGVYEFRFDKHGHKYRWRCTEVFRDECLYAVGLDGHNRQLNLSLVDAVFIQDQIREVIQPEREWLVVEASPVEESDYERDRWWLFSFLATSAAFWGWVMCRIIASVR